MKYCPVHAQAEPRFLSIFITKNLDPWETYKTAVSIQTAWIAGSAKDIVGPIRIAKSQGSKLIDPIELESSGDNRGLLFLIQFEDWKILLDNQTSSSQPHRFVERVASNSERL